MVDSHAPITNLNLEVPCVPPGFDVDLESPWVVEGIFDGVEEKVKPELCADSA